MSITATGNNPVLITVDTTATTDARTDNVATPVTADTRAWRYNDGISVTIQRLEPGTGGVRHGVRSGVRNPGRQRSLGGA
jgi:hypothetical protein